MGIEVTRANQGIFISQKKYNLELLKEYGVLNVRPYKLPKDPSLKLKADMGSPLVDPETYRRLIGKLIYLTVTRPDICYTVQLLSQFMQNPTSIHMQAAKHLLRAIAITCCEVTWVVSLLKDLGLTDLGLVDLHCDNQAALHIDANPMFHAWTKHIEVDCHFVRDHIKAGLVKPSYVNTKLQLADVFTKVVSVDQHKILLDKLGVSKSLHS
ncbi:cysteine-rich receptor-like protein kinase 8 [Tanacetum coccineum]